MFEYQNGVFTVLNYGGTGFTAQQYLFDVNDNGDYVGLSACCRQGVSFLEHGGVFTTIAVPGAQVTEVEGLNDSDEVVGWYEDASNVYHGFLYQNGTYTTIDVPGVNTTFQALFDINDSGELFGGYADANSAQFNFIATPVTNATPEPGSWALAASGALLLTCRSIFSSRRR